MRFLALCAVILGGCATTSADVANNPPQATFSSLKAVPVVLACVQRRLDMFEWGLCPRGDAMIYGREGHSELVVDGARYGIYATLAGQQKGDKSVYELRVNQHSDWGLCSMSGVFTELAQECM